MLPLLLPLLAPPLLQVLNSTQEQIGALVDEVAALVPANASDAGPLAAGLPAAHMR